MTLDLRRLTYFIAVAEELHFSRAAERLGIAQPPLSQQIQKLESELGAQLFDRSRRSVELTAAGRALLPEARKLLALSGQIAQLPRDVTAGRAGRLHIGMTGSTGFRIVPQLLRRFRAAYPKVDIALNELPTTDQIDQILAGEIAVGLARDPQLPRELRSAPIWSEPLVAVLPGDHDLASGGVVDIAGLAAEPFVLFPRSRGPGLHDIITSACREAGFSPHIAQEAVQMQTTIGLVAAGFGVSIVPASVQDFRLHGVAYRQLDDAAPRSTVAAIWHTGMASPVRDRFLEIAGGQSDEGVHASS